RAEADERETTRLFTRLLSDRTGFLGFFAEARSLLDNIGGPSPTRSDLHRWLHTLKGNTAIYGLESIASLCHELEDKLVQGGSPSSDELSVLEQRWQQVSLKVRALVVGRSGDIEIPRKDYGEILAMLERGAPRAQIRGVVLG